MEFTKERLLKIQSWSETYGPGSNVILPAEEAEELVCIALASLEAEPVCVIDQSNLDYLNTGSDADVWCAALFTATGICIRAEPFFFGITPHIIASTDRE